MTTAIDVYLLYLGWSPTIQNTVTNLPKDGHPFSKGWSPTNPRMVPPSKGMVTYHPQDGHQPTVEWSTTILWMVISFPRMVTHHFQDDQLDLEFDSSADQLVL